MGALSISLLCWSGIFFAFEKLVSTSSYAAKSNAFYCCWFSLSRHQKLSSKPVGLQLFQSKGPNSSRSIDKVQILANEKKEICKIPRQEWGQCTWPYAKYLEKWFAQIYRALYGDVILVPIRMCTSVLTRNPQKHLSLFLQRRREFISRGTHKH